MEQIKQRDYIFDTLRGLCMWSIPISHFTRMAGEFAHASLGGVVYITINVFVMQTFMFLSGYFSKKLDKSRQVAYGGFAKLPVFQASFRADKPNIRLAFW
ncbi:fucose 4-O-acetylase-like acetyltransferase [Clostridiales Family XIII bacterium PM5-7]